jgi:hypothetical protein
MGDTSDAITKNISAFADPTYRTRTRLQHSFRLHVTDPAKVAAKKTGASPDTVEAHKQALPKNYAQFIAYCRAYPGFALDVIEEMGIDLDQNREAYVMFLQLQKTVRGE